MSVQMVDQDGEKAVNKPVKTVIKVIGVGGGGGNALNNMISRETHGIVEFIAANTDRQALDLSKADVKIQLGKNGLGAGARPEVGAQAANESREEIAQHLRGADMLFITAGMGGGTGTGAAPIIAEVAQELGILTVAIVTKPFSFEGSKRNKNAQAGVTQLKNRVHSLIVILNDKLEEVMGEDATVKECFEKADEVLYNACAGIAEIIHVAGLMNVDLQDVHTIMAQRGTAIMGAGEAEGPDRAEVAASQAISNPLLEGVDMNGAKGVLLNISTNESLKMSEFRTVNETIRNFADPEANIIIGTVVDESLGDKLRVTVIATGLNQEGTDDTYVREGGPEQDKQEGSTLWNTESIPPAELGVDLFGQPEQSFNPGVKEEKEPVFENYTAVVQKGQQASVTKPSSDNRFEATGSGESSSISGGDAPNSVTDPNPFAQAFSRPISQPDSFASEEHQKTQPQKDNTIFGNFQPVAESQGSGGVFATLNVPRNTESGLWTNGSKEEVQDKGHSDPKEGSGEKAHFEYEIPAFLRKKN